MAEKDEDLLHEIRQRYDQAEAEWSPIRDEGDVDLRYVAGDPWDPKDRASRESAGRPCLALDEIGQYLNQVINQIRANPRAMKFSPTGSGANDDGAQFYSDKARETEYRSHAQLAYTTAYQNCVERSYGWVRLTTKFEHDKSFNQDIWIEDIPNPNMVLPDPLSKRPDSSDLRYLFYRERMPVSEFTRRWPDAKITEFGPEAWKMAPAWFSDDRTEITVSEYWVKEIAKSRTLLLLSMGKGQPPVEVFEDDLPDKPEKARILRSRKVDTYKVTQYLTNGVEILETNKWKGKYIPFASCFGKVIYVEGKRRILSMTRLARDPYMLYCYYRTCEAELVGMTPKFPYFVYRGQLDPDQWENLAKSLHEPVAAIQVEPVIDGTNGQVLPHPQRQPYDPPIQALEVGAEAARRGVQSAIMGSPLPTSAQRHNEKSGVALQQIEKSGQIGSFHYADHYDDMIRHVGVMFEDLCDKILDAARDTGIHEADGTAKTVRVNDPKPTAQQFPKPDDLQRAVQAWQARLPKGTEDSIDPKGDYLVTVSSGPKADSEREAVSEFVQSLMGIPVIAERCADLIVKLQGATMGFGQLNPLLEELADRITPPEFKKPKDGEGPDPQQLMQAMQQGKQENEQLKAMLQKLSQEIATKQVETTSKEKIAHYEMQCQKEMKAAELASKERMAAADREVKLAVAELGDKGQQTALFLEERARLGQQQADAELQAHSQGHERGLLEAEHEKAKELAAQQHAQALEQADAGVAGDLTIMANQPQPEAGV